MKNVLTAVAALLTFVGAYAQEPSVLSDNHAMLRLDASARYLLLPMQESEENAHVRVIVNNKEVNLQRTSCCQQGRLPRATRPE